MANNKNELEFVIYGSDEKIEVLIREETIWATQKSIAELLTFNRYDILTGYGRISQKTAADKATEEYKEYNKHQKITSDFDNAIKGIEGEMKDGK